VDPVSGAISVLAGGVQLSYTAQSVYNITAYVTDASGPSTALTVPFSFFIYLFFL
jgi:hypothetical protein